MRENGGGLPILKKQFFEDVEHCSSEFGSVLKRHKKKSPFSVLNKKICKQTASKKIYNSRHFRLDFLDLLNILKNS